MLLIIFDLYSNSDNYYRPQRSWAKVIFSEACVKNSVHGGVWSRPGSPNFWGVSNFSGGFQFFGGLQFFGGGVQFFRGGLQFFGGSPIFQGGESPIFRGSPIFQGGLQIFKFSPTPPHTVNERPVRILLECILVCVFFCTLLIVLFLNTIFSFIFLSLTTDWHTKYFRYRYILSLQGFDPEEIFPELLIAVVLCVLFSWSRFRPMFLPSLAKLLQSQSKSIDALYQIQIAICDSCATMGSTSLLQGDNILEEHSSCSLILGSGGGGGGVSTG